MSNDLYENKKVQHFNFNESNWQTNFIVNKLLDVTAKNNTLLNLPDCMCFTFGMKEIISLCEIKQKTNNDYFKLINSFYSYLKNDFILKKIDNSLYLNLLTHTKEISENNTKINAEETKSFYKKIYKSYRIIYFEQLQKELIEIISGKDISESKLDFLIDLYINELLSIGYSFSYISFMVSFFYYDVSDNKKFKDLSDFLSFLYNPKNDVFDIFIPLQNTTKKDITLIKKQFKEQKILKGDKINKKYNTFEMNNDIDYCHIFFNWNDFVYKIEENLNRINSIFNFLKFYTNSQIGIDISNKILIVSKKIGIINWKTSIKKIMQYSYYQGNSNLIDTVNSNFSKLDDASNKLLIDLYDIMNYSQKNFDIFSNDQFLSKWISLETISSKSITKNGFDSVTKYVPKFLTISFYRKTINRLLKNSRIGVSFEDFIIKSNSIDLQKKIQRLKNNYYKYQLSNYSKLFSNPKLIASSINETMIKIENYLYRIYILRNSFVHEGRTNNKNDMLRYYLNILEPFYIDKVIKTINSLMRSGILDAYEISWKEIYDELNYKYDFIFKYIYMLDHEITTSAGKIKLENELTEKQIRNYIANIFLEHSLKMDIIYKDWDNKDENKDDDEGNVIFE